MSLISRTATMFPGSPYWTASVINNNVSDSPTPWIVERVFNPISWEELDISKWSFVVTNDGSVNNGTLNLQANNSAQEQTMLSESVSLVVFVKYNNDARPDPFYVHLAGC